MESPSPITRQGKRADHNRPVGGFPSPLAQISATAPGRHSNPLSAAPGTSAKLYFHWVTFTLSVARRTKLKSSAGAFPGFGMRRIRLRFQHLLQKVSRTWCDSLSSKQPPSPGRKTNNCIGLRANAGLLPQRPCPKSRAGSRNTLSGRRSGLQWLLER